MPIANDNAFALRYESVVTREVTWHVESAGTGRVLLLLHGTGSSTHSFAELLPLLATRYRVIAVDLPGHGKSEVHDERALSLTGMAHALANLLNELDCQCEIIVGHSAGAALASRMLLDQLCSASVLISINGAFLPFGGPLGQFFSPVAKVLASSSFLSQVIARRARAPDAVERLLRSTGSVIDEQYVEGYRKLFRTESHVAATLGMMAKWDLWSLERDMPRLDTALHLLVGERDQTVPPEQANDVADAVRGARVVSLPRLGHLAHEEAPDQLAQQIFESVERSLGE
ncbi:MAG: alpha/beta fold hydrolase BchO [Gammaproteobacteria bacterium]